MTSEPGCDTLSNEAAALSLRSLVAVEPVSDVYGWAAASFLHIDTTSRILLSPPVYALGGLPPEPPEGVEHLPRDVLRLIAQRRRHEVSNLLIPPRPNHGLGAPRLPNSSTRRWLRSPPARWSAWNNRNKKGSGEFFPTPEPAISLVGDAGFEPATSSV